MSLVKANDRVESSAIILTLLRREGYPGIRRVKTECCYAGGRHLRGVSCNPSAIADSRISRLIFVRPKSAEKNSS